MKRILLYLLFFLLIGIGYQKLKENNKNQEIIELKNLEKVENTKKNKKQSAIAKPQKDDRKIEQAKTINKPTELPVLLESPDQIEQSYDPNDLVSCETQIGNCMPKPEPEPEDPNANTFCITYASNCNSQESIQRKWNEDEVFRKEGEDVNPETIPRDSPNILDEYNRKAIQSRRNPYAQPPQINNPEEKIQESLEEFNEIPDYSNEQQEEY